jgi:hypothetical protein
MTGARRFASISAAVAVAVAASAAPPAALAQDGPSPVVSNSGTGQALVIPYYTVRDTWVTTINIMNTSNLTVAVKARFREHKNSRDVLDFNIIMSPYDAWTAWLEDTPSGPRLRTNDNSCTSPTNVDGALMSSIAYTGEFDDNGGSGVGRMREGHVELLVMGVSDENPDTPPPATPSDPDQAFVPYYAKHVDGTPRDCDIVDAAFIATAANWVEGTDPLDYTGSISDSLAGSGDPPARIDFRAPTAAENPLKANVTWLKGTTGTGAGTEAIAVSDYSDENLVTAQQFPWFLEPTLASSDGLWTVTGVESFEDAVSSTATMNEWASNPNNGAATDMVLAFPTKLYHVDRFNDQIQAAVSKYRNGLTDITTSSPTAIAPFEQAFGPAPASETVPVGIADSPITVEYDIYDREEGTTTIEVGGTSISPAPPPEIIVEEIRFEANVIQFGDESVLDSANPARVDASGLLNDAPNGWVQVNFVGADGGGLPVVGFVVKARTRAEASSSYGQAMQNGYVLPQ